jgi:hypothetical protein
MLIEKVKAVVELMNKPKKEASPIQIAAAVMEVMALIENGEEVPAEAFALLPAEIRQGGMLLMLGVIMQAVTA